MRYELFIDDKRVDLPDDNIALNYKSNLLSDITKIVSNNSYTIKLPKTSNNMALFGHVEMVSSTTNYPYVSHNGILFRDGIEIIRGASVVLLKVGEGIEIALVWNDTQAFNQMVKEGASLRDMPTESEEDMVVWQLNLNQDTPYYPIANRSWGLPVSGSEYVQHPCVPVSKILSWMEAYNGMSFNFPSWAWGLIDKLIIPLISKDVDPNINAGVSYYFGNTFNNEQYAGLLGMNYTTTTPIDEEIGSMVDVESGRKSFKAAKDIENITLDFILDLTEPDTSKDLSDVYLHIYAYSPGIPNRTIYRDRVIASKTVNDWYLGAVVHLEDVTLFTDDVLLVSLNVPYGSYSTDGTLSMGMHLLPSELKKGDIFPLVKNLPDMKQVDFLKAITQMLGLYAYPDKSGNITFISFDSLYDNKERAKDWSSLVLTQEDNLARDMEFALDDMAQRNWYRYKEDSSYRYKVDSDAYIDINNRTLEWERDAVELPFAPTMNDYILAYSYNKDGEVSYEGGEDRILQLVTMEMADGSTRYGATFTGLEWKYLLSGYQNYRNMVTDAKIITEYIKLSSLDLKNLEMDVPVYLSQHGAYFAIISVKTKENDICEVNLIKM